MQNEMQCDMAVGVTWGLKQGWKQAQGIIGLHGLLMLGLFGGLGFQVQRRGV